MGKLLKHITHSLLAACALPVALSSCNAVGCTDNQNSIPLAGFYSYSTLKAITVDKITVGGVGAPNDSVLIYNGSTQQIYLPFRPLQDTTAYYIHYNTKGIDDASLNDTLRFAYRRSPYFASEECGAMYRYVVTSFDATRHLIDSVALVDSVITNIDRETIRIYFRTAQQSGGGTASAGQSGSSVKKPVL